MYKWYNINKKGLEFLRSSEVNICSGTLVTLGEESVLLLGRLVDDFVVLKFAGNRLSVTLKSEYLDEVKIEQKLECGSFYIRGYSIYKIEKSDFPKECDKCHLQSCLVNRVCKGKNYILKQIPTSLHYGEFIGCKK